MAETVIKPTLLTVKSGGSPDEEGFRLYLTPESVPMVRNNEGGVTGAQVFNNIFDGVKKDADGKLSVDLATLPGMTSNDGMYNLGVAAYDAYGHESALVVKENERLDFVAPNAPSEVTITRS